MRGKAWLAVFAAGLLAGAAVADDVHLKNGETFEGVIAEQVGESVRIRLEFGEIKLAASSVDRIERSESPLSGYLERRRDLRLAEATATQWLNLARWARGHDLDHGYRESLLTAASIDPHLDALRPGMRELGYVYEAELDRWISEAEYQRRHRPPPERRAAVEHESPGERASREVEESLSRAVELLAAAQLEREARETEESRQTTRTIGPSVTYGFPVAHFGGQLIVTQPEPSADGVAPQAPSLDDLARRTPGSLLPVGGANSGTRIRQPGSLIPVRSSGR